MRLGHQHVAPPASVRHGHSRVHNPASSADGTWLCQLAAAGDADTRAQVVASTLGVAQRVGRSLERSIVEFLRPSRLLLVLDICERLLDVSGRLAAGTLAGCPGVRVLATSREALAVPGEEVWPLRAFEVPDPESGRSAAAASGSVRLLASGRPAPAPASPCRRRTRPRWSRSAAAWTACRWPSS
jgi:predicted ATPase